MNAATPTADAGDATQAAQAALAGEHACVYGYGVVGANLENDESALEALGTHRSRRDTLAGLIRSAGAEPEAAATTYALPSPVTGEASATNLAAQMEQRLTSLYADLVGAADTDELREFAAQALIDATVTGTGWGADGGAFPGLDDRVTSPDESTQ